MNPKHMSLQSLLAAASVLVGERQPLPVDMVVALNLHGITITDEEIVNPPQDEGLTVIVMEVS